MVDIIWLDGFENYKETADFLRGNYNFSFDAPALVTLNPRTGSMALSNPGTGQVFVLGKSGLVLPTISVIGEAVYPTTTNAWNFGMWLGRDKSGWLQDANGTGFRLRTVAGGFLTLEQVTGGSSVTLFTDTQMNIPANTYSYIEMQVDFSNLSNVTVTIVVNGNVTLAVINGITFSGAYNQVQWAGANNSNRVFVDDIYVADTLLGAQRCYTIFPNADQTPQDWALSSGSDAYQLINDRLYNTANYIQANNPADISKFGMDNLPMPNAAIHGMKLSSILFNDDAGSTLCEQSADIASGIYTGSQKSPSSTPTYYNDHFALNSVSVGDINNMSMLLERIS